MPPGHLQEHPGVGETPLPCQAVVIEGYKPRMRMRPCEAAVNHCAHQAMCQQCRRLQPAASSALAVPAMALGGNTRSHCLAASVFADVQDSLPNRAGRYPEEKQAAASQVGEDAAPRGQRAGRARARGRAG